MANKNPNKKTRFKDGNKGGPGRTPLPEAIREISNHTKTDIINAYYRCSQMGLKEAAQYQPITLLEAGIMKCFADFIHTGKTDQIRHIWAECHGKPKESVDVNMPGVKRFEIAFDDHYEASNTDNISTTIPTEPV